MVEVVVKIDQTWHSHKDADAKLLRCQNFNLKVVLFKLTSLPDMLHAG